MDRERARKEAFRAVDDERYWQQKIFPVKHDDATVLADLSHMVSVLAKYVGGIAQQSVNQADVKPVNSASVARNSKKVAAVAIAVIESLLATDRISIDDLRDEGRGDGRKFGMSRSNSGDGKSHPASPSREPEKEVDDRPILDLFSWMDD